MDPFPPPGLLTTLRALLPVILPPGFRDLAPSDPEDFSLLVDQANLAFLAAFPTAGIALADLLTAADIWGPLLFIL